MNKTLLIVLSCIAILFSGIGYCSVGMYKEYKNFPPHLEKEVVYEKYKTYLLAIDQQVAASTSKLSLAANLETMPAPNELIFLALNKISNKENISAFDENHIDIIDKHPDSKPYKTFLKSGVGYGVQVDKEIIIIEHPIQTEYGVDKVIIHFNSVSNHKK